MIDVEVLATGSKGNCYLLTSGEKRILLDCGLPYKKTLKLLDFKLPTAVMVTHEHKDHATAAADFIKHGVDVYMTCGTAMALGLEENHRLHLIEVEELFSVGHLAIMPCENFHDAAEPVKFAVHDFEDGVFYVTDTGNLFGLDFARADDATKILLETNFSEETLQNSTIDPKLKQRILGNHLSVEKAAKFLEEIDLSACKEIYLIHISARHGDGEEFKNLIQKVVGEKIKVIVAKNKELA